MKKKILIAGWIVGALAFIALPLAMWGDEPSHIVAAHQYKIAVQGNDEEIKTPPFKVGAHWKVTCTCSKVGPDFGVQIFAVPDAGNQNLQVIDMTTEGEQSAHVRDGGTWRLHVIGFGAAFNVKVEEEGDE
jgi:hypothetical protein